MKNKELAFDYLVDHYNIDQNYDYLIKKEDRFEEPDKAELKTILESLGGLIQNRNQLELMQSELVSKKQEIEFKNFQEVSALNIQNTHNTITTIMNIKTALQQLVSDSRKAYNYIMIMYITAFVLGIGLIATSIVFAAQGKNILAIAFGAVGLIDLATTFFYKPPTEIQNSRSNLAQIMIVITHWFAELMNLNSYIAQRGTEITLEEMKEISEILKKSTSDMVELIEKNAETK